MHSFLVWLVYNVPSAKKHFMLLNQSLFLSSNCYLSQTMH